MRSRPCVRRLLAACLAGGLAVGVLTSDAGAGTSLRVRTSVAKTLAGQYLPELEMQLKPLAHRNLFVRLKSTHAEAGQVEVEQFSAVPPGWSFRWFKKGTGEEVTAAVLDDGYVFNLGAAKRKTFRVKIERAAFSIETACLRVSGTDDVGGVDVGRVGINRAVITCI